MANVNDIYAIVNEAAQQSLGSKAIAVIDLQTFISLGTDVLSSSTDTDSFYNALIQRVGKTIISNRPYNSKLSGIIRRDQTDWGQIVQKMSMTLATAETDQSVSLTDGESVDQYKVAKGTIKQKLFKSSTAYQWKRTYQRQWLKQAFTSPAAMGSLISLITQRMSDSQTLAEENLTALCIDNLCAELNGTARQINVLSNFNNAFGTELTTANALQNVDFLKYVSAQIDILSKSMERMGVMYNDGSVERHTPKSLQTLLVGNKLDTQLRIFGYSSTVNADYMKLPKYTVMTYWQDAQSPDSINVNRKSDGSATSIPYQLALIADYEALGTYRHDLRTYLTPFNAAGEYYNQFIKAEDMYFNDLSENAVSLIMA